MLPSFACSLNVLLREMVLDGTDDELPLQETQEEKSQRKEEETRREEEEVDNFFDKQDAEASEQVSPTPQASGEEGSVIVPGKHSLTCLLAYLTCFVYFFLIDCHFTEGSLSLKRWLPTEICADIAMLRLHTRSTSNMPPPTEHDGGRKAGAWSTQQNKSWSSCSSWYSDRLRP